MRSSGGNEVTMPANLPPVYRKAEEEYRRAQSTVEEIACLEKMLTLIPKHKGTDHLRADRRRKLSKLKDAASSRKGHSASSLMGGSSQHFAQKVAGAHRRTALGIGVMTNAQIRQIGAGHWPDRNYPVAALAAGRGRGGVSLLMHVRDPVSEPR